MKRILCAAVLFLALSGSASAQRHFTGTVEWGGGITLARYHSYNYVLDSGYRMIGKDFSGGGHVSGFALAGIGMDLGKRLNTTVLSGYEGVDHRFRVYPILVRLTSFREGPDREGWMGYAEAGIGLQELSHIAALLGRFGVGYRFPLTRHTAVDLTTALRLSKKKPDLFDPDSIQPIPAGRIAWNNQYSSMLSVSLSLSFR